MSDERRSASGPGASRRARPVDFDLRAAARTGPVHFMGICGSGMSALAELVVRAGGRVTGCDLRAGAAATTLRGLGADIVEGHDPDHVEDAVAVVTTAAVPADHPELIAARERGIPVLKRAEALGALVNRGTVVAIAGTHGKTTTTAMATAILAEAGLEPTGFVGGRVPGWGGGLRPGADRIFVVEADEYDRSFLTLRPNIAVVTTVDADHLDIFGSLEAVEDAFCDFLAPLPADGLLAGCIDDPGVERLLDRMARAPRLPYGLGAAAALRALHVEVRGRASRFLLQHHGELLGDVILGVPGVHNVRNALGAAAAAFQLGADFDAVRSALGSFSGVARRFQELGHGSGVVVIDDYAHHPAEIAATLLTARATYPGRRLVAVFQPHLYTRTRDLADAFGPALGGADLVVVTDVFAARERPIEGITGETVLAAMPGPARSRALYEPSLAELPAAVAATLRAGDVCVVMGAGDIDEVGRAILTLLGGEVAT
jgi:UDP-N-acetylmuramate--alanine ligase